MGSLFKAMDKNKEVMCIKTIYLFLRDVAYMMGYKVDDSTRVFPSDVITIAIATLNVANIQDVTEIRSFIFKMITENSRLSKETTSDFYGRVIDMCEKLHDDQEMLYVMLTLIPLIDIAYITGNVIDNDVIFHNDAVTVWNNIIGYLFQPNVKDSDRVLAISDEICEHSKYQELNSDVIDRILSIKGLKSSCSDKGLALIFRDLALIMGYSQHEMRAPAIMDAVMEKGMLITGILSLPDMAAGLKAQNIDRLIWEISKRPDLNREFLDKVLAIGGLPSHAMRRP